MNETKPYELKTLTSKDVFPMFRIISKFGIGEFKKCFDPQLIGQLVSEQGGVDGDKLTSIVGMNIAFDVASIIVENVPKCEDEIYNFLAQISNLKRKDIEKCQWLLFSK